VTCPLDHLSGSIPWAIEPVGIAETMTTMRTTNMALSGADILGKQVKRQAA